MSTRCGIVYATASKMVRRIVSPGVDVDLNHPSFLLPGESMLIVLATSVTDLASAEALVAQATGQTSASYRCAVIAQDGTISDFLMADPTVDHLPGARALVGAPPEVDGTATYSAGIFTMPGKIIPAGIDKDGNPYPRQIIPPATYPATTP
jgi:hypothetical protein